MFVKTLILFIGLISLNACVSSTGKETDIVAADKSAGIVKIGFQNFHGGSPFYVIQDQGLDANWESGMIKAKAVCRKWGYSDAEWLNKTVVQSSAELTQDFTRLIQCVN